MSTSTEIDRVIKGFYCIGLGNGLMPNWHQATTLLSQILTDDKPDISQEIEAVSDNPYQSHVWPAWNPAVSISKWFPVTSRACSEISPVAGPVTVPL